MNTLKAFRSIFWKELRYNWRWAVAGSVALIIDLLVNTSSGLQSSDLDDIWDGVHAALSVAAPLIAILLGVLQIVPELSRDRWAFFLHRPAQPGLLLAGKVACGLSLYLLATLAPFLSFSLWMAAPGNVAGPFDAKATVLGFIDIALGIPFYLAAVLSMVQKEKWTKILPLVAALSGPLTLKLCTSYWQILLIAALLTSLFALALRGAFGRPDSKPRTTSSKIAAGFIVAMAVGLIQLVFISAYLGFPRSIWPKLGQDGPNYHNEILDSGDVLQVKYMDNNPISAVSIGGTLSQQSIQSLLSGDTPFITMAAVDHPNRYNLMPQLFENSSYVQLLDSDNMGTARTLWYLVNGHLLQYSRSTRRCLGELTLTGFGKQTSTPGVFRPADQSKGFVGSWAEQFLRANGSVYYFDAPSSRLIKVIDSVPAHGLDGLTQVGDHAILSTDSSVYLLSMDGKLQCVVQRSYPKQAYNVVSVGIGKNDHFYVEYSNWQTRAQYTPKSSVIQEYSSNGALVESHTLPPLPKSIYTVQVPLMTGLLGASIPAPLLLLAIRNVFNVIWWMYAPLDALPLLTKDNLGFELYAYTASALVAGLLSASLSILLSRRSRRTRKATFGWAIASFFLSWTGLVVQLYFSQMPVMVECAVCGNKRNASQDNCEECGANWPAERSDQIVAPASRGGAPSTKPQTTGSIKGRLSHSKFGGYFCKEIKASWRWAVLAGAAIIIAFFTEIYANGDNHDSIDFIWQRVQLTELLGSAAFGLALSILQIYPELSRDRWAFLMHRPASRDTLFLGKVAAGLLLYGLTSAIAFLVMTAWIVAPGKFPFPFVWGLTEAGWAAIIFGSLFYFAGFLVMLRPARWYGSRLLPIAAATLWTIIGVFMPAFWGSMLVYIPMAAIMCLAARNTFGMPSGARESNGAMVCLGAVLTLGIAAILLVCFGGIVAVICAVAPDFANESVVTNYVVDPTGNIATIRLVNNAETSRQVLKRGASQHNDQDNDLEFQNLWSAGDSPKPFLPSYSEVRSYVETLDNDESQSKLLWYLVNHKIVAYSYIDCMQQGVLTSRGYITKPGSLDRSESFDVQYLANSYIDHSRILPTPTVIYQVDLPNKTMAPLLTGQDAASTTRIAQLTSDEYGAQSATATRRTVLLSSGLVHIFDDTGHVLGVISPQRDHKFNTARVAVDRTGHLYFWYSYANDDFNLTPSSNGVIVETDQFGNTLNVVQLPSLPAPKYKPAFHNTASLIGLGMVMGPLTDADTLASTVGMSYGNEYNLQLRLAGKRWNDVQRGQIIASLLCAMLAWFAARRAGLSKSASLAWTIFCGAFVWIALLLLICLYPWPYQVACPSCGKKRFTELNVCGHCGAGWPSASESDADIFEQSTKEKMALI